MTKPMMIVQTMTVPEIMIRPRPSIVILMLVVHLWRLDLNRRAAGIVACTALVVMVPPALELNSVPIVG